MLLLRANAPAMPAPTTKRAVAAPVNLSGRSSDDADEDVDGGDAAITETVEGYGTHAETSYEGMNELDCDPVVDDIDDEADEELTVPKPILPPTTFLEVTVDVRLYRSSIPLLGSWVCDTC